jgi:hypothetical protein
LGQETLGQAALALAKKDSAYQTSATDYKRRRCAGKAPRRLQPRAAEVYLVLDLSRGQIELLQNEHPKHKGTKGQRDKGLSLKDFLCTFDPLSLCDEKAQFVTVLSISAGGRLFADEASAPSPFPID